MARKGKGKSKAKKTLKVTSNKILEHSQINRAPHSFVVHRGLVGSNIRQLVVDMRKVMEPYTASNLRVHRKNVLKDFLSVAGPLGVTHILAFTRSETGINFKVSRLPRGPTLTFRIKSYCLSKDVISSLKRHSMYAQQFENHPLLVLNNFAREGLHFKLMSTMFQNMFPSINVNKIQLNDIRRCVLFNFDPETNLIDFRHYSIKIVPVGMSRGVKKLIQTKIPNMGRYHDVSEYLLNPGYLSESEAEQDGPHNEVTLPQTVKSRGNIAAHQSAVRLIEIGPRMTLQLLKIEEGLWDGEVIYHEFIQKTDEEIAEIKKRKAKKRKLKENRRKQQEQNVEKKKLARDKQKKKSLAGMKKKEKEEDEDSEVEQPAADSKVMDESSNDDLEDADWYRKEVGEEPDPEFFPVKSTRPSLKRKMKSSENTKPKKQKFKEEKASKGPKKGFQKNKGSTLTAKKPNLKKKVHFQQKKGKRKQ
ncbi:suppressor of SWI4 1 homolog [Ptychodera flava]|uniref:suppressor of SWI4 1 homolog n=1 Tax=Ptychodera flava TaxID=63121 RepID=UPI00396A4F15